MNSAAIAPAPKAAAKPKTNPNITTHEEFMESEYGAIGSPARRAFEGKAFAFYLCGLVGDLRTAAGLTQQQLADKIGVKRSYLSRIENGDADVQLSTYSRILDGLGYKLAISPEPVLPAPIDQMTDEQRAAHFAAA